MNKKSKIRNILLAFASLLWSNGLWAQDVVIYSTGFEASEGFTAGTNYQNTTIKYDGPTGQQWGTYFGTASTTGPITDAMSMQMRYYTSTPSNYGYTYNNFDLQNVTKVTFKAKNNANVAKVAVSYSTNGGSNYVGSQEFSLSTTAADLVYVISTTGEYPNVRVKFTLTGTTVAERLTIDNVNIYGITGENVPPEISNISQNPSDAITSSTTVSVSANVTDYEGSVQTVQLRWGTASDALNSTINMPLVSGSTFTTASNIPAQADGTTIYYQVFAEDNSTGQTLSSIYNYQVNDPATTTIPYLETFSVSLGDCYTYSVSGNTKYWIYYSSTGAAQMNGFNTGELEEDWLILPGVTLNNNSYSLTFDTWYNYGIDDANNYLKLYYSTNYAGVGNPSTATWVELAYTQPAAVSTWTSSGTINLSGIVGNPTWIGFKYHYNSGSYRQWQIDNISIFDATAPMLITAPESLTDISYTVGEGPSASKQFVLSGMNLNGTNVTLTAPANFQISTNNSTFLNSVTLTSYSGAATNIYVRLNSGLAVGTYSGNISASGGGASAINISLSGSVYAPPPTVKTFTAGGFQENFVGFMGIGFSSTPASGQLHSENWKVTGLTDGDGTFGGIHTTGDFARGSSSGGVSTGGIYAFNAGSGITVLGAQPTADDFSPGTISLKIQNTSGEPVGELVVSYDIYVYNDQNKSSSFNFAYSTNDQNYLNIDELNYTTPEALEASPAWVKVVRTATISGLSFSNGEYLYLRWTSNDVGGTDSRDEFGLTNINLTAVEIEPGAPYITLTKPSLFNFGDVYINNWSNVQFYDVSATNLTSNLLITPPTGFKVSLSCRENFNSSLTLVPSVSGHILNTRIYVRFNPQTLGSTSGVVTHSSTDATTRNLAVSGQSVNSQIPTNYYSTASGTGLNLIVQLHNIIDWHTKISYDYVWTSYATTDVKYNGKLWDMYSDLQCQDPPYEFTLFEDQDAGSSPDGEGNAYNREHSWPKSWWGGSEDTMYTDIHHLIPADRWVNIYRSNNVYGEVGTPTFTSLNGSKLGNNVYGTTYTGTAFEPIDEYKGDLARNHFYMVTRYNNKLSGWASFDNVKDIIDGTRYPAFEQWYLDMLLEWHHNDPVSQKEIDRNNAVYAIQGNRNPFIDNPQFAYSIWGNPFLTLGDVNGDDRINVLDVVWLVSHLNGSTPAGFVIDVADVNGDSNVNVSDLSSIIALIMAGSKEEADQIVSETPIIKVEKDGIVYFMSDGTFTAIQFELANPNPNLSPGLLLISDHILSFNADSGKGVIYSMSNAPISEGEVALIQLNDQITFSNVIASNIIHQSIKVNTETTDVDLLNGNNLSLNVFPNPTNGIFTVETNGINKEIAVYDLSGKVVLTGILNNKSNYIDLRGAAPGFYLIKVGSSSFKLIKQ